jgi:TctA family transporter
MSFTYGTCEPGQGIAFLLVAIGLFGIKEGLSIALEKKKHSKLVSSFLTFFQPDKNGSAP